MTTDSMLLLAQTTNPYLIAGSILFGVFILSFLLSVVRFYRRCPSNRVLVVWGVGTGKNSAITIHGGAKFVIPFLQDFDYLSLDPIQIEIPLRGALSVENIRVNVPSVFTVAVGIEPEVMQNAAVRLLGLTRREISDQASDIIFGQLRQVIASMQIEEINRDRDKFLDNVQSSLEPELRKIGLVLINVNITDITDDSGYIEAIGRKAASTAIQQAEIDVAEQQKYGAIGVAKAHQEQAIQVANADKLREIGTKEADRDKMVRVAELERDRQVGVEGNRFEQEASIKQSERTMRIKKSAADAEAIAGENEAKASVASSNATLQVKEAEAYELGQTRKNSAEAAVLEAQYRAQAKAAEAMAAKIEAEKRAQLEAVAKAEKARILVDAEAQAEKLKLEAAGEAAAIFAKLEAEARGNYELLSKKAQGLGEIVQACGTSQDAFQLLMLEHMETLSATAAQAISNIKFDKVIVWDSGNNGTGTGSSSTANFLQSMARTLPPMMQIMQEIGGVKMPEYFGKMAPSESPGYANSATSPNGSMSHTDSKTGPDQHA